MKRKSAIRYIYHLGANRGWNYDVLHKKIEEATGIGHLASATLSEIHNVLREVFSESKLIYGDDKQLYFIQKEAERNNVSFDGITSICEKKFKKRNIYALTKNERRGLIKAIQWCGKNSKKNNSLTKNETMAVGEL